MADTRDLTLLRFPSKADNSGVSEWLKFIWAMQHQCDLAGRERVFGRPKLLEDVPWVGYLTEKYGSDARVIIPFDQSSRSDEGVRICLDNRELLPLWEAAAKEIGY